MGRGIESWYLMALHRNTIMKALVKLFGDIVKKLIFLSIFKVLRLNQFSGIPMWWLGGWMNLIMRRFTILDVFSYLFQQRRPSTLILLWHMGVCSRFQLMRTKVHFKLYENACWVRNAMLVSLCCNLNLSFSLQCAIHFLRATTGLTYDNVKPMR